jgi:hypothetical protein
MDAGRYDQIILKVPKLENMDLFAVDTKKYGSSKFRETILDQGAVYYLEYPNSLFITVVSTTNQTGYFEMVYQFKDKDRDAEDSAILKRTIESALQ